VSGNYQNWNEDAPGGLAESAAAVVSATSSAVADMAASQVGAAAFMDAYGAAVVGGHGVVEGPGGVGGNAGL
jgi:hypothetical protein